jgi:hypothetical protein
MLLWILELKMRKKRKKNIINILNWIELCISDENGKKNINIWKLRGSYEDNKGKNKHDKHMSL